MVGITSWAASGLHMDDKVHSPPPAQAKRTAPETWSASSGKKTSCILHLPTLYLLLPSLTIMAAPCYCITPPAFKNISLLDRQRPHSIKQVQVTLSKPSQMTHRTPLLPHSWILAVAAQIPSLAFITPQQPDVKIRGEGREREEKQLPHSQEAGMTWSCRELTVQQAWRSGGTQKQMLPGQHIPIPWQMTQRTALLHSEPWHISPPKWLNIEKNSDHL